MKYYHGKLWGVIIGTIIGAAAGCGTMSQIKMSQREEMYLPAMLIGGVLMGIGGFIKGSSMDDGDRNSDELSQQQRINDERQQELRNQKRAVLFKEILRLGINQIKTEYNKEGRYWNYRSHWQNPVTHFQWDVKTNKNSAGKIETVLNGSPIYLHSETSGSDVVVKRIHEEDMAKICRKALVTERLDWNDVRITFFVNQTTKVNDISFDVP